MKIINKSPYNIGDIYISETNPEKDFKITGLEFEDYYDEEPELLIICWEINNNEAYDNFVCNKKGFDSMKELLSSGSNTFPYPYYGECNEKSLKAKISKYSMKKI